MSTLELPGLLAHHPLGFLAACGLLRSLTGWRDFGWTKLSWKNAGGGAGRFAVIDSERVLDIDGVTRVLLCRRKQQRESPGVEVVDQDRRQDEVPQDGEERDPRAC